MAVAVTALASGDTGAGGDTVITLSSSSPNGARVQYICIYAQTSTDPTVDGSPCGLTFVQVQKVTNGSDRSFWIYRARAASPTTGQPTITWGAAQFAAARMVEAAGVLVTGSNGADSVVQDSGGQTWNTTTTGATETLAAFADGTNNAAVIFVAHMGSAGTEEATYSNVGVYSATYWHLECAYKVGQDTSPSFSWSSTAGDGGAMALELAAQVGGSAAVTGTLTATANEADVRAGGKTIVITLSGETWAPA